MDGNLERREAVRSSFVDLMGRERDLLFKLDLLVSELTSAQPLAPWEIWALDVAAQEGIQLDFADHPHQLPSLVARDLIALLGQRYGMDTELSRWVVESFALALETPLESPPGDPPWRSPPPLAPVRAESPLSPEIWAEPGAAMIPLDPLAATVGQTGLSSPPPGHAVRRQMAIPEAGPHRVTLTRPWALASTAVTQAQWRAVLGTDPPGLTFPGESLPVHGVSWLDAINYCNALSLQQGLIPAYQVEGERVLWPDPAASGYRLPTEAEWEIGCRAGTETAFSTGATLGPEDANFDHQAQEPTSQISFRGGPLPVGTFAPNPWGLRDMHGNVSEWCWGASQPYGDTVDPRPPAEGSWRPARGGSWALWRSAHCASGYRFFVPGDMRGFDIGFRLARTREA